MCLEYSYKGRNVISAFGLCQNSTTITPKDHTVLVVKGTCRHVKEFEKLKKKYRNIIIITFLFKTLIKIYRERK